MLKNNIGSNAGIIWHMLLKNGKVTLEQIQELTNFEEHYILMALGWLAKENKIALSMSKGYIYAELSHLSTEYYY